MKPDYATDRPAPAHVRVPLGSAGAMIPVARILCAECDGPRPIATVVRWPDDHLSVVAQRPQGPGGRFWSMSHADREGVRVAWCRKHKERTFIEADVLEQARVHRDNKGGTASARHAPGARRNRVTTILV